MNDILKAIEEGSELSTYIDLFEEVFGFILEKKEDIKECIEQNQKYYQPFKYQELSMLYYVDCF